MNYEELKQQILGRIDRERDSILEKIKKASKCEDWEEIQEDIVFIIQGYGSIMMIERLSVVEDRIDNLSKEDSEG
jgi:hypothetical protein